MAPTLFPPFFPTTTLDENAYQFVLLPYMAHDSHPKDSLFIVSEADFRFYKEEAAEMKSEMQFNAMSPQ